jgi:hypothetical protein
MWPERENPLVIKANRLVDRGFIEGIQTGEGNNGWQLLLTGTRAAQGQTFGIGYRRADLFDDALAARATVRGTIRGAFSSTGAAGESSAPLGRHVRRRLHEVRTIAANGLLRPWR